MYQTTSSQSSSSRSSVSLFDAANFDDVEAAQKFIDQGVDVNALHTGHTERGCTALYIAANHGCANVAKLLLEHGADPLIGFKNFHGNVSSTAIGVAKEFGYNALSAALSGNREKWPEAKEECESINQENKRIMQERMEQRKGRNHGFFSQGPVDEQHEDHLGLSHR